MHTLLMYETLILLWKENKSGSYFWTMESWFIVSLIILFIYLFLLIIVSLIIFHILFLFSLFHTYYFLLFISLNTKFVCHVTSTYIDPQNVLFIFQTITTPLLFLIQKNQHLIFTICNINNMFLLYLWKLLFELN